MISQFEPSFGLEEANACYNYMMSGCFVTEFNKTKEFEKMISEYTNIKHCIMTTSGTTALTMALMAFDISHGDEVIVPNFTMIATPNSVKMVGAIPIFVDIDEKTLTLNLDEVKKCLTNKTKAIIYVSLNGRCNDLSLLITFCKENNLYLIHDSAQSLQSFKNNNHVGSYGDVAIFSFSPPKIISTGNGGCLMTNNDELSLKLKKLKDFGRSRGGIDTHDSFGMNFKFTDIQAVIGIEQMKKLNFRINRMKEMWKEYYTHLSKIPQITFIEPNDDNWCPWFIDIYVDNRDDLQNYLKLNNIGTRAVYPQCSTQKIYEEYNDLVFPVSQKYCATGLWLPSSIILTNEQICYICDKIKQFYKE